MIHSIGNGSPQLSGFEGTDITSPSFSDAESPTSITSWGRLAWMGPAILAQMLSRFLTVEAFDLLGIPKEFTTLVRPKNQIDNQRLLICGIQNKLVLHPCPPGPRFDALKECSL